MMEGRRKRDDFRVACSGLEYSLPLELVVVFVLQASALTKPDGMSRSI